MRLHVQDMWKMWDYHSRAEDSQILHLKRLWTEIHARFSFRMQRSTTNPSLHQGIDIYFLTGFLDIDHMVIG